MKKCPNCQRMYSDAMTICSKCGTPLDANAAVQQPQYQPQQHQQPQYQQPQHQPQYQQQYQPPQHQQQYQQPQYQQPQYQQPQYQQPPAAVKKIGFVEAVKLGFANYANFSGRSCRSEYWYWALLSLIVSFVAGILMQIDPSIGSVVQMIWTLGTLCPGIAVAIRRLHDVGKSGYFYLWILTGIGAFAVIYQACKDSQPGPNQYGPNPKGL